MVNSRRGRPAGGSDAREKLIDAARSQFISAGYAATSVRSIAREAGVSHTLVNYYFGSKEGLFTTVLSLDIRPSQIIAAAFAHPHEAPLAQAGHILGTLVALWEQPTIRDPVLALLAEALQHEQVRLSIAGFFGDEILDAVRSQLHGPNVTPRAAAIVGAIGGLVLTRYVLRVEPIASMTRQEVVRTFSPSVAVHLGPVASGPSRRH